jgi:hypothetical protein
VAGGEFCQDASERVPGHVEDVRGELLLFESLAKKI